MGSKQQAVRDVTVIWDDAKDPKLNVRDGGRYKHYKKGDLQSGDDDFHPSQIVVDLKLDLGDPAVSEVVLNDVHVKIVYSAATPPDIGWWNGAKWVKFRQVAYVNGVANVTLPSPWPTDPPIGTG